VKRIIIVVIGGSIMSVLDMTIVNVALARLSHDLHAGLNEIQWVASAYLLALAAVIPIGAWAVRRYGAFRVYLSALLIFTVGSALCAVATSAPQLIAFRVLQGMGGGLLLPTGITVAVRATGRQNIPKVMSAIGVPMVLAPVFGPTLGGFLLQSVNWHAIFIVNVPIGIATGLAAIRLLPRDQPDPVSAGRLDWPGFLLAATGVVGITYGLAHSTAAGGFTSASVLVPVVVGCLLVVAFASHARRIPNPLLDMKLYSIDAYRSASVVMFCLGAALFGSMILLPLYFQEVRGLPVIETGLLLMPGTAGTASGIYNSASTTSRLGGGLTTLCGLVIVVVFTLPFLFVTAHTPYWLICAAMAVRGFGVGLTTRPAMSAAFSVLRPDQVNDASPQLTIAQRVGGSLGVAVIAVVLQSKIAHAGQGAAAAASAFAATYRWVIFMAAIAALPAFMLWRVERRSAVESESLGMKVSEDSLVESGVAAGD
jgi:EmrB/QacA subfamily drug resistance transporter